jgi:hypothetical protein
MHLLNSNSSSRQKKTCVDAQPYLGGLCGMLRLTTPSCTKLRNTSCCVVILCCRVLLLCCAVICCTVLGCCGTCPKSQNGHRTQPHAGQPTARTPANCLCCADLWGDVLVLCCDMLCCAEVLWHLSQQPSHSTARRSANCCVVLKP